MKKSILAFIAMALVSNSFALEREFRVDRTSSIVDGYAVAWGIPNVPLDFEKIDALGYDVASETVNFDKVENFVVDLQTNTILTNMNNSEFADFTVSDVRFGNHYRVSLETLGVDGLEYNVDALAVIENSKWSSNFSKLLIINRTQLTPFTKVIDGTLFSVSLTNAIKKSITEDNIELFVTGSMNIVSIEKEYIADEGLVSKITLDFTFPRSEENSLKVEALVKLNFHNELILPRVISVTQEQY